MIKKALVALLSSAILATTVVSGVVATPTVAYAEETKVIKITEDDCIDMYEKGYYVANTDKDNIFQAFDMDNNVYTENGEAVYFLSLNEYDGLLYPLSGSAVIETDRWRYTVSYDGTSYEVTDIVDIIAKEEQEEKDNERAKVNKWISDMVICKHPSAGNVTLSASEKKGTLTVNKADIKTATKLDMMLKSKKAVTVKIKASSKSKAVNQFKSLRKLTGHANTYGVLPWIEADQGIPFTEKIDSDKFKKSGSFYTVNISKSISQNYTYLCTAYENAFKRAKKRNTGYDFVEGTHLCDCSDIAKLQMVSEILLYTHEHADGGSRFDSPIRKKFPYKDEFKVLASNKHYLVYVCQGLAELAQEIGYASGFKSELIIRSDLNHDWTMFKVKDSSGKIIYARIDNGTLGVDSIVTGSELLDNNDRRAMTRILGHYVLHGSDIPVR